MEELPINSSHPFWSATTGSKLRLTCGSKIMIITVCTISKPLLYKIEFQTEELYVVRKDAIRFIKNEWWKHYGSSTVVEMLCHENVPIPPRSKFDLFERDSSSLDSCPSSPSPQSLRKSLFRKSFPINIPSPRNISPRNISPRNLNSSTNSGSSQSTESPRSTDSELTPRSDSESPRHDNCERKSRTMRLLKKVSDKLSGK